MYFSPDVYLLETAGYRQKNWVAGRASKPKGKGSAK